MKCYQSGLRPGEGLGLQWACVELDRARLLVLQTYSQGVLGPTKTGRERYVDISDALHRVLTTRRAARTSPWVFPSPRDAMRPWSYPAVKKHFDRVRRAAGLRDGLTTHGLRHTWTTRLLERQIPLAYLSRMLGHSSVAVTADLYGAQADVSHPAHLDALPPTVYALGPRGPRMGVLLPFRPRPRRATGTRGRGPA